MAPDDCVLKTPRGEGESVRVRGCDLFDLADDGRIRRKDSFWKIVTR